MTLRNVRSVVVGCALSVTGCTSLFTVHTTALRAPDINQPGGYAPVSAADVRMVERGQGADGAEPAGCVRVGAVYSNWGYGDWIDQWTRLRPVSTQLLSLLREEAAAMGANGLAWPVPGAERSTYLFAYRCSTT